MLEYLVNIMAISKFVVLCAKFPPVLVNCAKNNLATLLLQAGSQIFLDRTIRSKKSGTTQYFSLCFCPRPGLPDFSQYKLPKRVKIY
jgi:hypothetical protein